MIVFPTYKDGHFVRPYLFLSGDVPTDILEVIKTTLNGEISGIISLPPCGRLDSPVASHPDMLVLPTTSGTLYTFGSYFAENRELFAPVAAKVKIIGAEPTSRYPNDILLNFLICGGHIIGRVDMLDDTLASLPYDKVFVRQGYARCSTCLFGANAITADKTIADALERLGVRVLRISPEGINLLGYDHGFIGGATAICGKKIIFFGDPLAHPDGEMMVDFIRNAGYLPITTRRGRLFDYGGVFLF